MVKSIFPYHTIDDFNRTGFGSVTNEGANWIVNSSSRFSVDQVLGAGVISFGTTELNPVPAFAYLSGRNDSSQSLVFKFRLNSDGTSIGPSLLVKDDKSYLTLHVFVKDQNRLSLQLKYRDGATNAPQPFANIETSETFYTASGNAAGRTFWCRFEYAGGTTKQARYRVWEDGREEPATWLKSTSVSSQLSASKINSSGSQGFWAIAPKDTTVKNKTSVSEIFCAYFYNKIEADLDSLWSTGYSKEGTTSVYSSASATTALTSPTIAQFSSILIRPVADNGRYKIKYRGVDYWVSTNKVIFNDAEVEVGSGGGSFRTSPTTSGNTPTSLSTGTTLKTLTTLPVRADSVTWQAVNYNGQDGWIDSSAVVVSRTWGIHEQIVSDVRVDTFDRTASAGWGFPWYGSVSDYPSASLENKVGSTQNMSALLSVSKVEQTNGGLYAFWGGYTDESSEFTVEFTPSEITTAGGRATTLRIGMLGASGVYDNKSSGIGYALEIPLVTNSNISLVYHNNLSSTAWSQVAQAVESGWNESSAVVTTSFALSATTRYRVKVQRKKGVSSGYVLKAKIWAALQQEEPSTFQLKTYVSAPFIEKGNHFINVSSSGSWGTGNYQNITFKAAGISSSITPTTFVSRMPVPTITNVYTQSVTEVATDVKVEYQGPQIPFSNGAEIKIAVWEVNDPTQRKNITLTSLPATSNYSIANSTGYFLTSLNQLSPNTLYSVLVTFQCGLNTSSFQGSFKTRFLGISYIEPRATDIRTTRAKIILPLSDLPSQAVLFNSSAKLFYKKQQDLSYSAAYDMTKVGTASNDNYAGVGTPHFGYLLENLQSDTNYVYKIVIYDPDGITSSSDPEEILESGTEVLGSFTTFGRKAELYSTSYDANSNQSPVVVEQFATSARVSVNYRWDINNEIAFSLRWKVAGQTGGYWFTYGDKKYLKQTTLDSAKQWTANIIGLSPGIAYELEVTAYHPVGLLNDNSVFTSVFTTKLVDPPIVKRPKHYLYKVYESKTGAFLGTLKDATQPSFSLYENGGVTDLSISLPRTAASIVSDKLITLGNRVDVWVIDHTSDGIGRNMITDGDMSLGAWTMGSGWSLDPTGGPDQSVSLKIDMPKNLGGGNYAISEEVPIFFNPKSGSTRYRVVISLGKLLESYKDDLQKQGSNYQGIADNLRLRLNSLLPSTADSETVRELAPQQEALLDSNSGLLKTAVNQFSLVGSVEFVLTAKTYSEAKEIVASAQALNCKAYINEEHESESIPHVLQLAANAINGQITAQIEYGTIYDDTLGNTVIVTSEESVSTVGSGWQLLKMLFVPPYGATTMRVRLTGTSQTAVGWVDKVQVMPQELLLYRGKIETIKSEINADGEKVTLEVLGLAAQLTDVYVRFKQWVERQPSRDQPKLIDNNFSDDKDPPVIRTIKQSKLSLRESDNIENRWSILFPSITPTSTKVRVYYDGDNATAASGTYSSGATNPNSTCTLYYTANLNENFEDILRGLNTGFAKGSTAKIQASGGLNLRDSAKITGSILLTMADGATVTFVDGGDGISASGWTWFKVNYQGTVGYCAGEYLIPSNNSTTAKYTIGSTYAVSSDGGLYLRTGPTTSASLVINTAMSKGSVVTILDSGTSANGYTFYKVTYGKYTGYCAGDFLTPTDGGSNSTVVKSKSGTPNRDKQYFEFTINDMNPSIPYKFIALFRDKDGVIGKDGESVVNTENETTAVFTRVRTIQDSVVNIGNSETAFYKPPTDPAQMLKEIIDEARKIESFDIYYTASSIKNVDYDVQYTFRDIQLRNSIDKIREFCPSQWHWFVDASGCIYLRGPQHAMTHFISVGREAISSSSEMTITNLKNVVVLKGRQDNDRSEPDDEGSIQVEVKNDLSVNKYGPRYLFIRDSNIKDHETAQLVALGRLDENQREERQSSVVILDKKDILDGNNPLRGYNVESFQPGDYVILEQSIANTLGLEWDTAVFNQVYWDTGIDLAKEQAVQIKRIQYDGDRVTLELSQRQPSAVSDFARLVRWQQMQEQATSD